jgi:hypothetical protein
MEKERKASDNKHHHQRYNANIVKQQEYPVTFVTYKIENCKNK